MKLRGDPEKWLKGY